MITFKEACEQEPVGTPFFVEDGMAWHRTYAECWGNTPEAKRFDPQLDMIRADYKQNVQAAAEADERFKPLVEEFWFHMTNSANSDGRWPPPPRKTCEYHRGWVEAEIAKTREALAALKAAVGATPQGKQAAPISASKQVLTRAITVEEVPSLNWKELQDALYYGHDLNDHPETCKQGADLIRAVFAEYERRGVENLEPPNIRE